MLFSNPTMMASGWIWRFDSLLQNFKFAIKGESVEKLSFPLLGWRALIMPDSSAPKIRRMTADLKRRNAD